MFVPNYKAQSVQTTGLCGERQTTTQNNEKKSEGWRERRKERETDKKRDTGQRINLQVHHAVHSFSKTCIPRSSVAVNSWIPSHADDF